MFLHRTVLGVESKTAAHLRVAPWETAEQLPRLPPSSLLRKWLREVVSIKVMALVWEVTDLNQCETLVALALADHANDQGLCWPSMDRVAAKARISQRQARRVMRSLESKGLILTKRGGGRKTEKKIVTNQYQFDLASLRRKADILSGLAEKPGHTGPETRTFRTENPDIAMSGESSLTINNLQEDAVKTAAEEKPKDLAQISMHLKNMRRRLGRSQ